MFLSSNVYCAAISFDYEWVAKKNCAFVILSLLCPYTFDYQRVGKKVVFLSPTTIYEPYHRRHKEAFLIAVLPR